MHGAAAPVVQEDGKAMFINRRRDDPIYRSALITGATGGLGSAFARALPSSMDLVITGRDRDALEHQAARLAAPGRHLRHVVADLSKDGGRDAVVAAAQEAQVDLFVCNAGTGHYGAFLRNAPDAERETVEVNVTAPIVLTRALLPGMIERARATGGDAGVLIVSSTFAFVPAPNVATYAASKAFELSFAEALAEEVRGEPVDVLALCPGPIRTNFSTRSGFGPPIPGALSPDRVAREGLEALGRRHVHVVGTGARLALEPVVRAREVAAAALGVFGRIGRRRPRI